MRMRACHISLYRSFAWSLLPARPLAARSTSCSAWFLCVRVLLVMCVHSSGTHTLSSPPPSPLDRLSYNGLSARLLRDVAAHDARSCPDSICRVGPCAAVGDCVWRFVDWSLSSRNFRVEIHWLCGGVSKE